MASTVQGGDPLRHSTRDSSGRFVPAAPPEKEAEPALASGKSARPARRLKPAPSANPSPPNSGVTTAGEDSATRPGLVERIAGWTLGDLVGRRGR